MKKKLIISVLVVVILISISTACIPIYKKPNLEEAGWLAVQTGNSATLVGMTGELLEKEELVVPKTVNGMAINAISSIRYQSHFVDSQGVLIYKAKKIFLPDVIYQFMTNENKKHDFPIAEKIVFISTNLYSYSVGGFNLKYNPGKYSYPDCFSDSNIYVPKDSLETYIKKYSEYNSNTKFYAANLSFYYNFEDAPNDGYYWVDDLNLGDKIQTVPENPTREGYEFCGWFKEEDYINEVKLSELVKGESEIELFAKWIKLEGKNND